jgi:type II secretory pathway pseudopilin PulG
VVVIISILLALALTSTAGIRKHARDTAALSDARTVALLVEAYAGVYKDYFPYASNAVSTAGLVGWQSALVESDKSLQKNSPIVQIVGFSQASFCLIYEDRVFTPDDSRFLDATPKSPRRVSDISFPSQKGIVWFDRRENGYADEPACCISWSKKQEPIVFADSSVERRRWQSLRGAAPLVTVRYNIGYPVFTTWYGLMGQDR